MRRTLFYALITLLAFIGGVVAFKYHLQKLEEQNVIEQNETIRKTELNNTGFAELEEASDGELITVQGFVDEKFLCLDVTEEQPNICTTVLIGNSSENKSLLIRLKVCNESDNSNCIVWKPANFCRTDKLCSETIRIYDNNSKPTDLIEEIIFDNGTRDFTKKSIQLRVTGKVSIEENKPKLLTPIDNIEIIDLDKERTIAEEHKFINDRIDAFFPIITSWMKNKKIDKYAELKDAGLTAHTKLLDVNNDKIKELAIQTNCSAVGNCELWIYQKYMDGFNVILKAEMVQTFELKKTKTNAAFDLETKSHGDAFSGEINIYKFDVKKYKVSECSGYTYSELKDGEPIKLKNPKITSRECSENLTN